MGNQHVKIKVAQPDDRQVANPVVPGHKKSNSLINSKMMQLLMNKGDPDHL